LIGLGEKYTIFTKTNQNSENFLLVLVSIVPVSGRADKTEYNGQNIWLVLVGSHEENVQSSCT